MAFRYNPTSGADIAPEALEAAYKRDSTLEWKWIQTEKIAKAYEDPGAFFRLKSGALQEVARKAAHIYKEEYAKLTSDKYKLPAQLAHNRAMKLAQNYQELLLADVEADFPSDLSNLSLQLTYDQGGAAKAGFATPSTEIKGVPSARKGRARK